MAKAGRPRINPEDKVKNQLVAIDYNDYRKIKVKAIESQQEIKVVIKKLVDKSINSI